MWRDKPQRKKPERYPGKPRKIKQKEEGGIAQQKGIAHQIGASLEPLIPFHISPKQKFKGAIEKEPDKRGKGDC